MAVLCPALALILAACASATTQPRSGSVSKTDITNETAAPSGRYSVAITRTAIIPGRMKDVFQFISAEDVLPNVLTGYGPLPAVVGTSGNTGPWDTPGSARVVHLADGSTVREQLTHYMPPQRFAYRVWEFGNPIIATLANEARGEWSFKDHPEGTYVEWTYTFTAKNAAASVLLTGITQILWRGYMEVCLENTKKIMAGR
jgi:hypothetical protein